MRCEGARTRAHVCTYFIYKYLYKYFTCPSRPYQNTWKFVTKKDSQPPTQLRHMHAIITALSFIWYHIIVQRQGFAHPILAVRVAQHIPPSCRRLHHRHSRGILSHMRRVERRRPLVLGLEWGRSAGHREHNRSGQSCGREPRSRWGAEWHFSSYMFVGWT